MWVDIQLVCKYKLDKQIAAQSRAFFHGLSDIIDPKCELLGTGKRNRAEGPCSGLRMFDQQELRQLIGGEETLIDLDDLREHTVVSGFPNDDTIRMFWKVRRVAGLEILCLRVADAVVWTQVVKNFDQEERRALLRFVTSCSRPPL